MKPKKILVTGDFLRADYPNRTINQSIQHGNIIWLHALLSQTLKELTGQEIGIVSWLKDEFGIDGAHFFRSVRRDPTYHSWLQLYNADPTNIEVDYFRSTFQDSFVVGFELSPYLKKILTKLNVPYINFFLHPVRFALDIMFYAESNKASICDYLESIQLDHSVFRRHASFLTAHYMRQRALPIKENSILFCGQVGIDASLIVRKSMVTLGKYLTDIEDLADQYNHFYFKKHPYGGIDEQSLQFLNRLPNFSFIDGDIYQLLSHKNIDAVAAISSGTLIEAEFFGKKTYRLLENAHNFLARSDIYCLDGQAIDATFWAPILKDYFAVRELGPNLSSRISNPIQTALVTNWKAQPNQKPLADCPPVLVNRKYHFRKGGNGTGILHASGWSHPEPWGVWNKKDTAELKLRLIEPVSSDVFLQFHGRGFARSSSPVMLDCFIGDCHIGRKVFKNMEYCDFRIVVPYKHISPEGIIHLSLITKGGSSPRIWDSNKHDTRLLALGLVHLTIYPSDRRMPCVIGQSLYLDAASNAMLAIGEGWQRNSNGCPSIIGNRTAQLKLRFKNRPITDVILEIPDYKLTVPEGVSQVEVSLDYNNDSISQNYIVTSDRHKTLRFKVPRYLIDLHGVPTITFKLAALDIARRPLDEALSARLELFVPRIDILGPVKHPAPRIPAERRFERKCSLLSLNRQYSVVEDEELQLARGVGWGKVEKNRCWTIGRVAELHIMPEKRPKNGLLLILTGAEIFAPPGYLPVTMTVFANGEPIERVTQNNCGTLERLQMFIPPHLLEASSSLRLRFIFDNLKKPCTVGKSGDQRQLGLSLLYLTLAAAPDDQDTMTVIEPNQWQSRPKKGVSIIAPYRTTIGLGMMARNVANALATATSPSHVALINCNESQHEEIFRDFGAGFRSETDNLINVFCYDPPRIASFVAQCGEQAVRDRYNICYSAWELEDLPSHLADETYIDEYWGISSFVAEAARSKLSVPVRAMPLPVDFSWPNRLYSRSDLNLPKQSFLFLYAFSADSTIARKNPKATLEAFQKAFDGRSDDVSLVFKTKIRQSLAHNKKQLDDFREEITADKRIILIEQEMNDDQMKSLLIACDAYVSLHRSEGFGLTMAEAMAYGKPTIGTGYSGNMDFMRSENSALVDYQLVDMDKSDYHSQLQRWADPDIEHAAHFMRKTIDDDLWRKAIARRGQFSIRRELSSEAVGKKYMSRFKEIGIW